MTDDAIAPYDPVWPTAFNDLGRRLRHALGAMASRMDHIGSTAVPGLDAKPILDVQISVPDLRAIAQFGPAIESCGFGWRRNNPELTKRYFREVPGAPRTHIHVRKAGSFDEQAALLFRDYLRSHREQATEYAHVKHQHSYLLAFDRHSYVQAKAPIVWRLLQQADAWAQSVGWEPGPSDC